MSRLILFDLPPHALGEAVGPQIISVDIKAIIAKFVPR